MASKKGACRSEHLSELSSLASLFVNWGCRPWIRSFGFWIDNRTGLVILLKIRSVSTRGRQLGTGRRVYVGLYGKCRRPEENHATEKH
jgi:hypothetical protein